MKINNNTSYNITLINGDIVDGYGSKEINDPSGDLIDQIKNLESEGIISVF